MFKEAFTKLDVESVARILDELSPQLNPQSFDPLETTIMALDLNFYPGYQFLDISNHSVMPPLQRFVVYKPGDWTLLNFTNAPVYALNKDVPIRLNDENIDDYIHFFFGYIRGKHGRFIICENVDDIPWKDDPPPTARKAIAKMMNPLLIKEKSKNGDYVVSACMVFKDSLFKSDVRVKPYGEVILENEELLIEDMPILDDTLGQ